MGKSAIVIGATGLVGREIVKLLLQDAEFSRVTLFVRRESGLKALDRAGKLTEHIVDFDRVNQWTVSLECDVLFSAMGTTLRAAGSEDAQYRVDYQYQWDFARAARQQGCREYVLISAGGADPRSPFFYPRMKGELETDVQILGFDRVRILRPGLLKGARLEIRGESRKLEEIANRVLDRAESILPRRIFPLRLKPIPVETVARAAVSASRNPHIGALVYGPEELWSL